MKVNSLILHHGLSKNGDFACYNLVTCGVDVDVYFRLTESKPYNDKVQ